MSLFDRIYLAAKNNDINLLRNEILKEKNASIDELSKVGYNTTPSGKLAKEGDIDSVYFLVNNFGANIEFIYHGFLDGGNKKEADKLASTYNFNSKNKPTDIHVMNSSADFGSFCYQSQELATYTLAFINECDFKDVAYKFVTNTNRKSYDVSYTLENARQIRHFMKSNMLDYTQAILESSKSIVKLEPLFQQKFMFGLIKTNKFVARQDDDPSNPSKVNLQITVGVGPKHDNNAITTYELSRILEASDKQKSDLINQHKPAAQLLLDAGVTSSMFSTIDISKLEKLLSLSKLDVLLELMTVEQLFNSSHTPPDSPKLLIIGRTRDTNHMIKDEKNGAYTFNVNRIMGHPLNEVEVSVTYQRFFEPKINLTVYETTVDKDEKSKLDDSIKKLHPQNLVTAWYQVANERNKKNIMTRVLYCPERKEIMINYYDDNFPLDDLNEQSSAALLNISYYQERDFISLVKKNGLTMDRLAFLQGMTHTKIVLLCDHLSITKSLLSKGIKFNDFAKVSDTRLKRLFASGLNIEGVSAVVDLRELLGLNHPKFNNSTATLFSGPANPFVDYVNKRDPNSKFNSP